MQNRWKVSALAVALVSVGVLSAVAVLPAAGKNVAQGEVLLASGGGKTILEGGSGAPAHVPVVTIFGFHVARDAEGDVEGAFECLALAPTPPAGPGSGEFNTNIMYVTGKIASAEVHGDTIAVSGTSTITGLGAGSDVPFTAVLREGGPGASFTLTTFSQVAGQPLPLTFHEIVTEGQIEIA